MKNKSFYLDVSLIISIRGRCGSIQTSRARIYDLRESRTCAHGLGVQTGDGEGEFKGEKGARTRGGVVVALVNRNDRSPRAESSSRNGND